MKEQTNQKCILENSVANKLNESKQTPMSNVCKYNSNKKNYICIYCKHSWYKLKFKIIFLSILEA